MLEINAERLGRPWMRAVGARCRAMLLAATGGLVEAETAAQLAMEVLEAVPMPLERARTQLLVVQLHRRRRHRRLSEDVLSAALATFIAADSPHWAARARAELMRTTAPEVAADARDPLTAAERQIAQRAAAGISNREIAAALFISTKAAEINLSRVYRKLGIRSRAQLHSVLNRPGVQPTMLIR